MKNSQSVDSKCLAYSRYCDYWDLPMRLYKGTMAMREARTRYLPRQYSETAAAGKQGTIEDPYEQRLIVSFLYNAYKHSVHSLRGKVFTNPVQVLPDSGDPLVALSQSIDNEGNDINTFANELFTNSMHYGLMYIFVDFPPSESAMNGRMTTLADNQMAGAKPFFVSIAPPNVIGWTESKIGSKNQLTQFRYVERVVETQGDYGEIEIEQIRVLYPDRFEIWRKPNDSDEYALFQTMPNSLGFIPIVPYYTQRMGPYQAISPLYDLATKNLEHWQEASMQKLAGHASRSLILFGAGISGRTVAPDGTERDAEPLQIGMHSMITSENPDAKLQYLEFPVDALRYGAETLKTLKDEMGILALGPMLQQQSGTVTATQRAIDTAQAQSILWAWAMDLQTALESAMSIASMWMSSPTTPHVYVNTDFGIPTDMGPELDILYKLALSRGMSYEWLTHELKRRDVLMDSFNYENDQIKIEAEDESMGIMGGNNAHTG